jgi:hypothetical protein
MKGSTISGRVTQTAGSTDQRPAVGSVRGGTPLQATAKGATSTTEPRRIVCPVLAPLASWRMLPSTTCLEPDETVAFTRKGQSWVPCGALWPAALKAARSSTSLAMPDAPDLALATQWRALTDSAITATSGPASASCRVLVGASSELKPLMRTTAVATAPLTRKHVIGRIAASLLGGWAFVWGFATLGVTGLVSMGQPYGEAHTATMLLAVMVFLVVFCWAFAAASLTRVWAVLAGGAGLMTAAAWLLQRSLL